jgi:saccharopine dehydrogenase-like NADP-dependent oxidoreductase
MKLALLGAGHIGQTIARLLAASGDYQITVVDQSEAALRHIPPTPTTTPRCWPRCAATTP